ncbi:MAG: hypothetical protein H5T33_05410 [Candidatus Methanosuratus sp.]|nr:hypothetical protein [Candidatus Methanosuratincola sp.]
MVYKTIAGKILYGFSDTFFMQWPKVKRQDSKGIYEGRPLSMIFVAM